MNQISDNASFSHDPIFQQVSSKQHQLQSKLNSYFQNRKASKQHSRTASNNNNPNAKPYSTQTMDFKILFTKAETGTSHRNNQKSYDKVIERGNEKHSNIRIDERSNGSRVRFYERDSPIHMDSFNNNNRENRDDLANINVNHNSYVQNEKKRKIQSEYNLNKKEIKQSLSKKKLNLMQYKLKQLEQEVELELQKKIDVYKQNEQLEKQIKRINENIKEVQGKDVRVNQDDEFNYEILELETRLRREKERNKGMKKSIERLRERKRSCNKSVHSKHTKTEDSIKNTYESQKNTIEIEKLKVELEEERRNYKKLKEKFEKNQELKCLSSELKKLRRMVEAKPKRNKY